MNRLALLLSLGVATVGPAVAQAPNQKRKVPEVLQLALARQSQLKYSGRRVVEFSRNGTTNRHEEAVYRLGPKLRIEFPSSGMFAGQIIVETAKDRRHFFPEKNEIRVGPPRREESFARLARMIRSRRQFKFEQLDSEIVAGRRTETVGIRDEAGNFVQKLNIDPVTGLLMRRRLYDPTGAQFGFFEFLSVSINPTTLSPSLFKLERRGATVVTPFDELRREVAKNGFQMAYLPPKSGYGLDNVRTLDMEGRKILLQVYAGEEGRVSLFQFTGPVERERLRTMSRGRWETKSWRVGSTTFVLAGSLPPERLDSLSRQVVAGSNGLGATVIMKRAIRSE